MTLPPDPLAYTSWGLELQVCTTRMWPQFFSNWILTASLKLCRKTLSFSYFYIPSLVCVFVCYYFIIHPSLLPCHTLHPFKTNYIRVAFFFFFFTFPNLHYWTSFLLFMISSLKLSLARFESLISLLALLCVDQLPLLLCYFGTLIVT